MYSQASYLLLLLYGCTNLAMAVPPKRKDVVDLPVEVGSPPSPEYALMLPGNQNFRRLFEHDPPQYSQDLWLVVPQTMDVIHTQGGVLPQGTTETSIYQHMHGNTNSVYVTAYESIHAARMAYASVAGTGVAGTLLCINQAENTIELAGSLPPEELRDNIRRVTGDPRPDSEIKFVKNKNYDSHYYKNQHQRYYSTARPRLAGLPLNHPEFANVQSGFSNELECDKEARAFMDIIAEAVGWRKEWPLVLPPGEAAVATEAINRASNLVTTCKKWTLWAEGEENLAIIRGTLSEANYHLSTISSNVAKLGQIIRHSGSLPRSTFNSPWWHFIHSSKDVADIQAKAFLVEAAQLNQKISTYCRNIATSDPLDSTLIKELKDTAARIEDIEKRMRIKLKANEKRRSEIIEAKKAGVGSTQFLDIKPNVWLGIRYEKKSEAIERDIHLLDELILLQTPYYKDLIGIVSSANKAVFELEAKNQERTKMKQKTKDIIENEKAEAEEEIGTILKDVLEAEKRKNTALEQAQIIKDNPNLSTWFRETLSNLGKWVSNKLGDADTAIALAGTATAGAGVGGKVAAGALKASAGVGSSTSRLGSTAAKNIKTMENVEIGNTAKAKGNSQVTAESEQVNIGNLESLLDSSAVNSPVGNTPVGGLFNDVFETIEAGPISDALLEQLQNLPVASGNPALQAESSSLAQSMSGSLANAARGGGRTLVQTARATPSKIKAKLPGNKYERLAEKRRRSIVRRDNGQTGNQELQNMLDHDSAALAIRAVTRAMLVGIQLASEKMGSTVSSTAN
ncbi:hypothetical protein DCS_02482 [Drechmeria coniospora]|uniref:Uncharacterized protein n=1 Tax=Drechmeria coniospora TaxID=98403 RepID=A0A151GW91_DRECN|nr:hypothetical protein DCS_02482 [Drechmeria coniospora]KYK61340.1 hypothetical protein DCS_02482 [Drechmeria coniospora]